MDETRAGLLKRVLDVSKDPYRLQMPPLGGWSGGKSLEEHIAHAHSYTGVSATALQNSQNEKSAGGGEMG